MIPSISELLANAHVVRLPLAVAFRGLSHREALLCEGPEGWSEFSPFVEYDDAESSTWLKATIDFGWNPLPPLVRQSVSVNATIPAVNPDEVEAVLARFHGCRTAKIKVAAGDQTLQEDIARVSRVRELLGSEGRIRLDANGGWNVDEAEHAVHALAPFDLEYVEQPCESLAELVELRQRTKYMGIPIAADESIRKASDPAAVIASGAADVLVLKTQPLGGVHEVVRLASQTQLPVVLSSALETSVGLSMGLAAACCVPAMEFDAGLATSSLLAADICDQPLIPSNGQLAFRRIEPSRELLTKFDAGSERTSWWSERLRRCYDLLEA